MMDRNLIERDHPAEPCQGSKFWQGWETCIMRFVYTSSLGIVLPAGPPIQSRSARSV